MDSRANRGELGEFFYFQHLPSLQARCLYIGIYNQVLSDATRGYAQIRVKGSVTKDLIRQAYCAMKDDHPELFYLGPISHCIRYGNMIQIYYKILYSQTEIQRIRRIINARLRRTLADVTGLSEWEKEKIIYERIVREMRYASPEHMGECHSHNIVGMVAGKCGVCEGYSKLIILAFRSAGIKSILVNGHGLQEAHCWNMAWINNTPYHLDATWEHMIDSELEYAYFNLDDEQIQRDHRIGDAFIPKCLKTNSSFFYMEDSDYVNAEVAIRKCSKKLRWETDTIRFRLPEGSDIQPIVNSIIQQQWGGTYYFLINQRQGTALIKRRRDAK